ncbi:hypothetical protein DTO280E4_4797 [Paecilomyces variotii]|nr:hypothetical protein DTO280E4_4797 [Paecilomyces variotii]
MCSMYFYEYDCGCVIQETSVVPCPKGKKNLQKGPKALVLRNITDEMTFFLTILPSFLMKSNILHDVFSQSASHAVFA